MPWARASVRKHPAKSAGAERQGLTRVDSRLDYDGVQAGGLKHAPAGAIGDELVRWDGQNEGAGILARGVAAYRHGVCGFALRLLEESNVSRAVCRSIAPM